MASKKRNIGINLCWELSPIDFAGGRTPFSPAFFTTHENNAHQKQKQVQKKSRIRERENLTNTNKNTSRQGSLAVCRMPMIRNPAII